MSILITGYFDTSGEGPYDYREPIPVFRLGNQLRDSDGLCWAVLDECGDWVSPSMKRLGIKSKQNVVEEAIHPEHIGIGSIGESDQS